MFLCYSFQVRNDNNKTTVTHTKTLRVWIPGTVSLSFIFLGMVYRLFRRGAFLLPTFLISQFSISIYIYSIFSNCTLQLHMMTADNTNTTSSKKNPKHL